MKNIVRLTESDIENLVRKVLKEQDAEYGNAEYEDEEVPFTGEDLTTEVFDFLDLEEKLGEKINVGVIIEEFREDLIIQAMDRKDLKLTTITEINDRVHKIAEDILDEWLGDNEDDLAEQDLDTGLDTSSSTDAPSGGGGTGAPEWETGVARGRGNPLQSASPYDTGLTRANANPLQSGAPWESKVSRGKGNPTYM